MAFRQEKSALFLQKWWWNITSEGKWRDICSSNNQSSGLSWPIHEETIMGYKMATMPVLTMYSGPVGVTDFSAGDLQEQLELVMDEFDGYSSFKQSLYPHFPFVDAFRKRGYSVSRRRTYHIDTQLPQEQIFANVKKKRRNCIRRGEREYTIKYDEHIDEQIEIVFETLSRKAVKPSYKAEHLKTLIEAAIKRGQGRILTAVNEDGQIAASIFLVWDDSVMYYLLGGYTELDTSSFATSVLLWNAILLAKEMQLVFDFEGSMIENIASFFRSFGAVEVPYYRVEKINSPLLRFLKRVKYKYGND